MTSGDTLQLIAILVGTLGVVAAIMLLQQPSHRRRMTVLLAMVMLLGTILLWRSVVSRGRTQEPGPMSQPATATATTELSTQPDPALTGSPTQTTQSASSPPLPEQHSLRASVIHTSPPKGKDVATVQSRTNLAAPSRGLMAEKRAPDQPLSANPGSTVQVETSDPRNIVTASLPEAPVSALSPSSASKTCVPSCQADFADLPIRRYDLPTTFGTPKAEYVITLDAAWKVPQYVHVSTEQWSSAIITKSGAQPGPPYVTHVSRIVLSDSPAKGAVGADCFWIADHCEAFLGGYRVGILGGDDPKAFSIVVQPLSR